jgi:glutathione S-transferase
MDGVQNPDQQLLALELHKVRDEEMVMIEVCAYATPNSVTVPIALEELALNYTLRSVNVKQGEQKQEGFLTLNPNAKVPVLVQTDARTGEAGRVTALLDGLLAERAFAAGDNYSIADIAHFGWFWRRAFAGVELDPYSNLCRWYASVEQRPAVQRAIARVNALVAYA